MRKQLGCLSEPWLFSRLAGGPKANPALLGPQNRHLSTSPNRPAPPRPPAPAPPPAGIGPPRGPTGRTQTPSGIPWRKDPPQGAPTAACSRRERRVKLSATWGLGGLFPSPAPGRHRSPQPCVMLCSRAAPRRPGLPAAVPSVHFSSDPEASAERRLQSGERAFPACTFRGSRILKIPWESGDKKKSRNVSYRRGEPNYAKLLQKPKRSLA